MFLDWLVCKVIIERKKNFACLELRIDDHQYFEPSIYIESFVVMKSCVNKFYSAFPVNCYFISRIYK
uniref:Uncharacterized protein n=1 Tax=Tetranychus urticae TaxID=32264 RepID=T1KLK9_TETUR